MISIVFYFDIVNTKKLKVEVESGGKWK